MEQINTNKWKRASSESLFATLIPPMNGNSWLQKTPFIFFRLKNFNTLVPLEAKAKDGSDGDAHGAGQTGRTAVSIHLLEQTCHSSHAPGTPTPLLSTRESGDTGNHSKNLPVPSAAVPRCVWGTLGACSTSSECAGFLSSPQFSWQFCGRALWGDFFQHSAWFSLGRCWCSVEELKGSLEGRQKSAKARQQWEVKYPKKHEEILQPVQFNIPAECGIPAGGRQSCTHSQSEEETAVLQSPPQLHQPVWSSVGGSQVKCKSGVNTNVRK